MLLPRYQFAYPYYRPETPDDHYRNNVFLERAFNNLPQTKLWQEQLLTNQFGLVVGTEVLDASVTVSAEIGEQFLVCVSGLFGLTQINNNNVPSPAGTRGHMSLYAYREGTEFALQRVADWTVPTGGSNQWKFDCVGPLWKSDCNGLVRFYVKVSYLSAYYAYAATSSTAPFTMTVISYGIGD
jgi:hypothetical protein